MRRATKSTGISLPFPENLGSLITSLDHHPKTHYTQSSGYKVTSSTHTPPGLYNTHILQTHGMKPSMCLCHNGGEHIMLFEPYSSHTNHSLVAYTK